MMNRPEIRNFFSAIIALIVAMVGQAFVRAEITLSQATVWFLGCAFAFGVFWVPSPIRRAVLRVIYVAVPILVAISLFVYWVLIPESGLPSTALGATIAGSLIASGWFVTFLIQEIREATSQDAKKRDMLIAIRSEITTLVEKIDSPAIRKSAKSVQAEINKSTAKKTYVHIATMESEPLVFDALVNNISMFDHETVRAIVRFYAEFTDLQAMIVDSRLTIIQDLPKDRRIRFHKALTWRRIHTLSKGLGAIEHINGELGCMRDQGINRSGNNPEITSKKTG